jgi:hypothetical protein
MDVLLSLLLSMGVTGSSGVSAKQSISTSTVATVVAARNPSAQEVRKKLGPDFQFLLNAPPPSGEKVNPGDAQILRSLCGTCTPEATNPWSTRIARKDGTLVTLADLYKMRQDGTGWRKITRQISTGPGPSSFSPSARSGKSVESGIFSGANRSMDGSAVLQGNGGERSGIVTGRGELVMGNGQGGTKGASSSGLGRGQ